MNTLYKYCKRHGELKQGDIQNHPNGLRCAICHRCNANSLRNANRDAFNAKQARDRIDNPDKWEAEYKRQYRKLRENQGELLSLKKVCNARRITIDRYLQMLQEQDFKCAICRQEETCKDSQHDRPRRLSIDHCHRTEIVRGLLCHSCNTAIGKFKDDTLMMQRAIEYIQNNGWVN